VPEPDIGYEHFTTPFVALHHCANLERAKHDRSIAVDSYLPSIVTVKAFFNINGHKSVRHVKGFVGKPSFKLPTGDYKIVVQNAVERVAVPLPDGVKPIVSKLFDLLFGAALGVSHSQHLPTLSATDCWAAKDWVRHPFIVSPVETESY
jgi:hypothetical protein